MRGRQRRLSTSRARIWPSSRVTRNAVALMASTVATAILGVAFWVVAARAFSQSAVGRGAAQISAMTLLAQVAQVNLSFAFMRFLPNAGSRTRRLVVSGYSVCSVLGAGAAIAFVLTPLADDVLPGGWGPAAVFTVSVALWTIFVVQDGVLTGLRRAVWVPVENSLFGVAKLALLPLFGALAIGQAVFLAWTIPAVPAIVVVNALVFARFAPREPAPTPTTVAPEPHGRRAVTSFLGAQYLASVMSAAATFLIPVIVIQQLGATANAHFYIPWLVGIAFSNLLGNVVSSFIVEASHEDEPFPRLFWRAVRLMGSITALGMVVTLGVGPLLLRLLSGDYADSGTALIRWIGLSLPFGAVIWLTLAGLWMRRQYWLLAALESARTALLIGLTTLLIGTRGIDAPGIALVVEVAVFAALCLPWLVRWYRQSCARRPSGGPAGKGRLPLVGDGAPAAH